MIKAELKRHYTEAELSLLPKYSIQDVYDELKGDKQKVTWDKMAWNRLSVSKHRFISWLAAQSKLQTTARMAQIRINGSDRCLICNNGTEDHVHFFFQCQYSEKCLLALKRWLGITTTRHTFHDLIRWIQNSKKSKFVKQVYYAGLAALFCHILFGKLGIAVIGMLISKCGLYSEAAQNNSQDENWYNDAKED
ncbi:uncharacterized protein LOC125497375 [Beta vulgaris subsp. vulgaris]|uniref:uncharacterized protein LOC125497375 n=1 Tax=Beta vulgaris subsp. vulgaris TaxID=3555 RepID=UPI002036D45D|nr:uncharacterized protein LOC125497375 [Beta vulgaris subsp. vulgaris]